MKKKKSWRKLWKGLSIHSKLVCYTTLILILGGASLIFALEYSNVTTIGNLNFFEKIQACLFQSITLRTAGFATFSYTYLNNSTKLLMIILMFIGGSPVGTAGGIKTVTFVLIVLFIYSQIRGQTNVVIFKKTVVKEKIYRALMIFAINLFVLLIGIFLLTIVENHKFIDLMYEAVSAMATVGLTIGITSSLTVSGKIVIILLMFIGRIGILTFLLTFVKKKQSVSIHYPEANVIVG